ncbi:farnesol dehydrogenase-like [Megalopta genalis]|uniref:farnesol dehydrogenase-like n=1 Tax=Megalopta genalis TaxID=115081 RepID=UPI003FD3391E
MNRWTGKVAVVTGASAGIGAAISRALVKDNVKVVGLARREDKLLVLTDQLGKDKFFPVVCDLRKEEDIVKAFNWVDQKLGGVDILINNAGVSEMSAIIDTTVEDYRRVLDTNVIAPAICAREAVKSIKKRNVAGHIVNISSIAGHNAEIISVPIGMYGASKYALTALATELRHEIGLANLNVKVTNVSPGAVMTDMLTNAFKEVSEAIFNMPTLQDSDVADAVMYALGTPPVVEVYDILVSAINKDKMLKAVREQARK